MIKFGYFDKVLILGTFVLLLVSCQSIDLVNEFEEPSKVVSSKAESSEAINVLIEEAGTLSQLVPDVKSIKKITITGPINGTDINCIRTMSNLKVLDLENADIVAGGEKYGIYAWSSSDPQSTENNKITRNLFEASPCETIIIPKSVTSIHQGGFIASKITSIIIPETIKSMGEHVFTYCSNLESITILADLEEIPSDTFEGCSKLSSVKLPDNLKQIKYRAFDGCTQLKSIVLPEGLIGIASEAFFKTSLSTIIIPSTVTNIGNSAFNDTKLEFVRVPESVISVGTYAFESTTMRYVFWDSPINIDADMFDNRMSSNCIIYIEKDVQTPAKWNNIVYNGIAEKIELTDAKDEPFYCPKAFKAKSIKYIHTFTQTTGQGESAGWETIVLPFNVQRIVHEDGRVLAPFNSGVENAKPFWLRSLNGIHFENVTSLRANIPYIIAMPNNEVYERQYCVNGKVTFEANDEVNGINILESPDNIESEGSLYSIFGTYNTILASNTVYPINKNDNTNSLKPGSNFIRSLRDVKPFECYLVPRGVPTKAFYNVNDIVRTKAFDTQLENGKKRQPFISDL